MIFCSPYHVIRLHLMFGLAAAFAVANPLLAQTGFTLLDTDSEKLDFRDINIITEPGAGILHHNKCWAYAMITAYESNYMLATNTPHWALDISEESVFDCLGNPNGYQHENAMRGYRDNQWRFLEQRLCRGCTGSPECNCDCRKNTDYAVDNYDLINHLQATESQIKNAICEYGGIAVSVAPGRNLSDEDEVYILNEGGGHAVVVVGWDDANQTWLVEDALYGREHYYWVKRDNIGWRASGIRAKDNRNYLRQAAGAPVACLRSSGSSEQIAIFNVNRDCQPMTAYWEKGYSWITNENSVAEADIALESNLAVTCRNDKYYVFWITEKGAVQFAEKKERRLDWSTPASAIQISEEKSASVSGSICAISRKRGHLDVFWIGPRGEIFTRSLDSTGRWLKTARLGTISSASPEGSLVVTSRGPDKLELFWTATSGHIRTIFFNERRGWYSEQVVVLAANTIVGKKPPLSAVVAGENIYLTFATPTGKLAQMEGIKKISIAREMEWTPRTIPKVSLNDGSNIASVLGKDDGAVHIFGINDTGLVFALSNIGRTWSEPTIISTSLSAPNPFGGINAVARADGIIDVFWTTQTGELIACWKPKGKNWALPYKI